MDDDYKTGQMLSMTSEIVVAHVANNSVAINDLPMLIANVHQALAGLGSPAPSPEMKPQPKVPVRASVKPDYLVCLESGKKVQMLRRHLRTNYDMTPEQYREKWGLPKDYPMVAPNYTERRRELAVSNGLGTKAKRGTASKKKST